MSVGSSGRGESGPLLSGGSSQSEDRWFGVGEVELLAAREALVPVMVVGVAVEWLKAIEDPPWGTVESEAREDELLLAAVGSSAGKDMSSMVKMVPERLSSHDSELVLERFLYRIARVFVP